MVKACRLVTVCKKGTLAPSPDFRKEGVYFFVIPEDYQSKVKENGVYLFKYGAIKKTGKSDARGKPIHYRVAIPMVEMPFDNEEEANACISGIITIMKSKEYIDE